MGIYSSNNNDLIEQGFESDNLQEIQESYVYDELSRLSDEQRQEFVNSPEAEAMVEAGILRRKTLVRLSRNDDKKRRKTMAALHMAKQKKDPLYIKYAKFRKLEKECLNKIRDKYDSKSERAAKIGQKQYLKNKIPITFIRK